jgi:hypothetical protein
MREPAEDRCIQGQVPILHMNAHFGRKDGPIFIPNLCTVNFSDQNTSTYIGIFPWYTYVNVGYG